MKVLVTGAKGFVGRHLTQALTRAGHTALAYDMDSTPQDLERWCRECDFVFHLAAVSRPPDPAEYRTNNLGITETLLGELKSRANPCPVMLSSSIQASLLGRFEGSPYGLSKLESEEMVLAYGKDTGAKTFIYRFPNLFGPWARANYGSVVATFCHNIARGLPIQINGRDTRLELVYIDDLMAELMAGLAGRERRCEFNGLETVEIPTGRYCAAPRGDTVTLGELADLLEDFQRLRQAGQSPQLEPGSFADKLYQTYLSYLPDEKEA